MKINVDESIISGSFSQNEVDFAKNYFNKTEATFQNDDAALVKYKADLAACSDEFKNLYQQAEAAGIQLKFISEETEDGEEIFKLSPDTIKDLDEANLKYQKTTVAARLYAKAQEAEALAEQKSAAASAKKVMSMEAENAVKKTSTQLSLKEQLQTEASTIKGNAHNAMLSAKAGLYKLAAAGANALGIASLKELGIMAGVTAGITLLAKGIKYVYDSLETKDHLRTWAENPHLPYHIYYKITKGRNNINTNTLIIFPNRFSCQFLSFLN